MIPTIPSSDRPARWFAPAARWITPGIAVLAWSAAASGDVPAGAALAAPAAGAVTTCLSSGDGYLRAHIRGAFEAEIDWPNSGTACEGGPKLDPAGVRLSFRRVAGGRPNLLFLFGLTGVREGEALRDSGVNLTIIVQGTDRIYGTRGDSRCTADSLTQRRLGGAHVYRLEVRGFCTQPAHAVRGEGAVVVSRFDFAGIVNYEEKSP